MKPIAPARLFMALHEQEQMLWSHLKGVINLKTDYYVYLFEGSLKQLLQFLLLFYHHKVLNITLINKSFAKPYTEVLNCYF